MLFSGANFEVSFDAAIDNYYIHLKIPDPFYGNQIHELYRPWSSQHMTCFQQEHGKAHVLFLFSHIIHGCKMVQSGPPYGQGVENRPGNRTVNFGHVLHCLLCWDN